MSNNYTGTVHKLGDHIDTDAIIPARFLVTTDTAELGSHCMEGLEEGWGQRIKTGDFIVAGRNFGCGSSREHAPWALVDLGLRAVVSSEIADIFRSNALKNGLLPVVLDAEIVDELLDAPGIELSIDIAARRVTLPDGRAFAFPLDAFARTCLLEGVDQLGYLLKQADAIAAFEQRHALPSPASPEFRHAR